MISIMHTSLCLQNVRKHLKSFISLFWISFKACNLLISYCRTSLIIHYFLECACGFTDHCLYFCYLGTFFAFKFFCVTSYKNIVLSILEKKRMRLDMLNGMLLRISYLLQKFCHALKCYS